MFIEKCSKVFIVFMFLILPFKIIYIDYEHLCLRYS
nr:MAG TPA: hypothetical protein [Caudoviricetes sp.]